MANVRQEIDCESCYNRTTVIYNEDPPMFCPVCGEKQEDLIEWSDLDFEDDI